METSEYNNESDVVEVKIALTQGAIVKLLELDNLRTWEWTYGNRLELEKGLIESLNKKHKRRQEGDNRFSDPSYGEVSSPDHDLF